jgi:CRP-like cAMP-binding protein
MARGSFTPDAPTPDGASDRPSTGGSTPQRARQAAPAPPVARLDPHGNRLLAALPDADFQRLVDDLEPVAMPLGMVLYESGVPLRHAYFPVSAVVSLMYVTEGGGSAGIAVIGCEGMVGVPLIMGGGSTPGQAVVQSDGAGIRMSAAVLRAAFAEGGALTRVLLRFTQALIAQMAQIAVCNRHHSIDQQLCRWLLVNLDRLPANELAVTQELISQMLGVRREGVTEAALSLQRAGLIDYRRGHITVLDRDALEHRACECHGVIRAEYDRLLPRREVGDD